MKVGFVSSAVVLALLAVVACSSDSEPGVSPAPGADAGNTKSDAAKGDDDDDDDKADDDDDVVENDAGADAGPRPAPVFLDGADYADLIAIDAKFPYGVTQLHAADSAISGSKWGRHGGPMVTLGIYGGPGEPTVMQWKLPADVKAAATSEEKTFKKATGLPTDFTYGADGLVDLFGGLSLLDYTPPGSPYPGEALIYDSTYQTVKSRAHANGFYSGAGIADGNNGFLVYSALSPLATQDSTTNDNALYVTGICGGELLAANCPVSRKLFGWKGNSGPVVTDIHGNVFVGASLTDGATSDAVYGLGKKEVTGGATVTARAIIAADTVGTATVTALAPDGSADGWVLGLGYAENAAIYAAPYTEKGDAVEKGTAVLDKAITRAKGVDSLSVFSDAEGDLWVAVVKGTKGTFVELRRK